MSQYETTLLVKPQCFVYKPPPRTEAKGYRAKDWNLSQPLWTGRLVIKSQGTTCVIHLENEDGSDFATCPVYAEKKGPEAVEKVLDSSRYFVLRIEDGSGRAAYIGMGFNERNDAFDFTAAIQDHQKFFDQQQELERTAAERASLPAKDFSLKEGETLKINIPTKKTGAAGGSRRRRAAEDDDDDSDGLFLPPPPEFDAHPAPSSASVGVTQPNAAVGSGGGAGMSFDFGQFGVTAPSPATQFGGVSGGYTAPAAGAFASPSPFGQPSAFGTPSSLPYAPSSSLPFASPSPQPFSQPTQQPFMPQNAFAPSPFSSPSPAASSMGSAQPFGYSGVGGGGMGYPSGNPSVAAQPFGFGGNVTQPSQQPSSTANWPF